MSPLWWGYWDDYPKVSRNGREYAEIGGRLYTQHAVSRFLPSGRRTIGGVPVADKEGGGYNYHPKARSISPLNIEHTIKAGTKTFIFENGEHRTIHTAGDLTVVTTLDGQIVITCMYTHDRE